MQQETYNDLSKLVRKRSGQDIPPSKAYLMEARLAELARREGFANLDDLVRALRARPNVVFEAEVAAELASKDTQFFRERDLFDRIVDNFLPKALERSDTGNIRIWCAGGGTGQEAYSLAMLLAEAELSGATGRQIDIISTDLCNRSIEAARLGAFGHFDVQRGLSIHRLLRHFTRLESGQWQISTAMRSRVGFRRHNLLEDATGLGKFDVIVCMNTLSGMTFDARRTALANMSNQLTTEGILVAASSESLSGLVTGMQASRDFRGALGRQAGANTITIAA